MPSGEPPAPAPPASGTELQDSSLLKLEGVRVWAPGPAARENARARLPSLLPGCAPRLAAAAAAASRPSLSAELEREVDR